MGGLAERVIEVRESTGKIPAEFAREVGISKSALSQIEDGSTKTLKHETALGMQRISGYRADWIATGRGSKKAKPTEGEEVGYPIRNARLKLSAGISGYAIDYLDEREGRPLFFGDEWFKKRGFSPEKLIATKVGGPSMEPGLHDGDTVVINLADTKPVDGEVFACNFEGEMVIKRLKRDAGEWWLSSDNSDKRRYGDKRCTEDVFILGRIVVKNSERI